MEIIWLMFIYIFVVLLYFEVKKGVKELREIRTILEKNNKEDK